MNGQNGVSFGSIHRFDDPDHFHAAIRGGQGLLSLLARGTFTAELTTIQVGRLTLQRGRESLPRLSSSGIRPNRVGILGWLGDRPLPIVRGVQMCRGEWLCLGSGMEPHHRTPGPVDFVALTLDADDLAHAAIAMTGVPLAVIGGKILRMPEHLGAWLVSVIEAATCAVGATPGIFTSPSAADALEHALLRPMIMCLLQGDVSRHASHARRVAAAKRFEAAVETNFGNETGMANISRSIGLSVRALHTLSQEQFGLSPARFMALRRLHSARRALLQSDHRSASVTQIAMDHGIWQLGRFAVTYKSLFGESPSATLRRPPGQVTGEFSSAS
jgi:AraC-like DNA-binding protein